MKKNRTMRAAALLLALTLITSCFVGGTFAKYVSEYTGTDTATVAKWAFEINDAPMTNTFTFNLFETVADVGGTTDDANVKDGKLIAPGTSGKFDIKLENLSDVDAEYKMDFEAYETNGNIPILYSLTGEVGTWKSDINQLDFDFAANADLVYNSGTATKTVYWKWDFGDSDAVNDAVNVADTTLGTFDGDVTVKVDVKVTVQQVD